MQKINSKLETKVLHPTVISVQKEDICISINLAYLFMFEIVTHFADIYGIFPLCQRCKNIHCCSQGTITECKHVSSVWAAVTSTIDWVLYKQQKFIFHSSGGRKVQDEGASSFAVWWGTQFLVNRQLSWLGRGARELSGASFIRNSTYKVWGTQMFNL